MGTVFTIDVRDPGDWGDAIADVLAWLHRVDTVFSTYKPDSDISRLQRGELRLEDADPDIASVLDLCACVQLETDGWFSAMHAGRIDPTGLVKGWAIERASSILTAHGSRNHGINGGGDMQLAGSASPDLPWRVGVSDPRDRTRLLTVVQGTDFAVATSGVAERGHHLLDPFTRRPGVASLSATVVGPSLTRADAYATAAFLCGAPALRWPRYATLLVAPSGSLHASPDWPRYVA